MSHKRTLSGYVGGNVQSDVSTTTPAEFVRRLGGTNVIEKILIANNGIAVGGGDDLSGSSDEEKCIP